MEAIKNTIAENFTGGVSWAKQENQFTIEDCPSLKGKTAVITGASEGIGYGAAHTFLKNGIDKIHMISANKEHADNAKALLADDLSEDASTRMQWHQCDLADWDKVARIASEIKKSSEKIDIVFCNSARGIMTAQLTEYGVDRHMAINHFAHVILVSHLLPVLKKTAESGSSVRIVNQASNAHQGAPSGIKFESLEEINKDEGPNGQYGKSKLAGILYARYLAKHLTKQYPNIIASATHPGFVKTRMSEEHIMEPFPIMGHAMKDLMAPFKKDQFEGALSAVYACTTNKESGAYICPPAIHEPGNSLAQDEQLAENLMKLTVQVVDEKTKARHQGCPITTY